ncbi:hypothetical protein Tco_0450496 [Tanacetum coccineum]
MCNHRSSPMSEVQDVPTKVSSAPPSEISMITILDDLRTQLDGHLKVNQEQSLVNDSLRAELARCKQEMVSLERNKVKHDLDPGVKPATGASKPMSKSDTRNHSTLPAKSEKARRVEDHHRNLNKKNHVDSRLNVKRTGFVLNSNNVCNVCNECLIFVNHDKCVVRTLKSVKSVYPKTPKAKHNMKTTKKVWKAKVVASVKPQWKPTG